MGEFEVSGRQCGEAAERENEKYTHRHDPAQFTLLPLPILMTSAAGGEVSNRNHKPVDHAEGACKGETDIDADALYSWQVHQDVKETERRDRRARQRQRRR